jgi:Peptidase M50B-like
MLTAAQRRTLEEISAELGRLIRYDDESLVHEVWVRQRYDCGCYPTFRPARQAAVRTAWHEAGHAVAALATGARFSSASIHHGTDAEGRVHRISGTGDTSFVIDAAGQIAERLMAWTMLDSEDELRRWLQTWRADGGDARRFRRDIAHRFPGDEVGAWRYSEGLLVPMRPAIRHLARALLVHPRHIGYAVVAALIEPSGKGW